MKKTLVLFTVLSLLFSLVPASAATFTLEDAQKLCDPLVVEGAILIESETDDNRYTFEYLDPATSSKYKFKVDPNTQAVSYMGFDDEGESNAKKVVLAEQDIRDIVEEKYPGAEIKEIAVDTDDDGVTLDVRFSLGSDEGKLTLNPESGKIVESEYAYNSTLADNDEDDDDDRDDDEDDDDDDGDDD